jgi:hypothetical protein
VRGGGVGGWRLPLDREGLREGYPVKVAKSSRETGVETVGVKAVCIIVAFLYEL